VSNHLFSRFSAGIVLLGSVTLTSPVSAVEPCPWQGAENQVACAQWDLMARRLEAAEARAAAAENALQSMEQALQSMETALQEMAAQSAPAMGATTEQQTAQPSASTTPTEQAVAEIAQAPAAASEGEQQARALIDQAISRLEQSLSYQPGRLIIDKNYPLQAEGQGYRATFNQFAFEFEDIRVDAAPASFYIETLDEDRTALSLKISDSVRIIEDEDALIATISFGSQTLAGIWSESARNAPEFQLDLGNINVAVSEHPGQLSIGRLAAMQQLNIAPDEQWQQVQTFLADAIQFDSGEGESFSLAGLSGEISVTGQQYSKLMTMSEDIQQLVQGEEVDLEQSPEAIFDYLQTIFSLFDSYQFTMAGRELNVLGGGASIMQIGSLNISNQLNSDPTQGGNFGLSIALDQLGSQMAPLPPDLLPHQMRMQMAVDNIPPNLIKQFFEIGMGSEQVPEEQQDMYWQQQLLALLMSSQLELRVIDTFIAADSARADLNLRAAVDSTAAIGGVGELNLRIAGMQTLIDISGAQQDESAAPVLAMITAFSDRTEENGTTIDTFDLKFSGDGKLFLNGKDVTAMFMPGAAPQ